ncbi:ankyrin repeat-containing domain protein [Aspergillus floccosus]
MHQRKANVEKPYMHTCKWILELKEFEDWMNGSSGLLWIKGKPGAGKSTLMAFLYEQFIKPSTANPGITLELFFSVRGTELQRTPLGMLRSLLNQLYRLDPDIRPAVRKIFQDKCDAFGRSKQSWEWQQPELERILHEIIVTSARKQSLTVFVDALDEAGQESAQHLVKYFHQVNESIARVSALGKLCISCRHYPVTTRISGTEISVDEHNHDDITAYIRDFLRLDYLFTPETADHRSWEAVITYLLHSAKGLFHWIRLVVPLVEKKIQDGESPENVRQFLRRVPGELRDTYEYILRNIVEVDYRSHSYLLFQWYCLAERPLSATELRYAICAINITTRPRIFRCENTSNFVSNDDRMKRQIRAWSGGLVEVVEEKVQVVHQSVNDYILPEGLILLAGLDNPTQNASDTIESENNQIRHCHSNIYYSCLHYLLSVDFDRETWGIINQWDFAKQRKITNRTKNNFPLLDYATTHIFSHATKAGKYRTKDLEDEISLVQQVLPKWIACYKFINRFSSRCPDSSLTLLHQASGSNLTDIVRHLLSQGGPVDQTDSEGNTALHYAAKSGSTDIVKVLVNRGADMQMKNKSQIAPFIHAAGSGHIAVVEFFLKEGFDVSEAAGLSGNALQQASRYGLKEMVTILLDAGANINAVGGEYGTALQAASVTGSTEVVQQLLDAGANVNAVGGRYGTALQAALYMGSTEVVQQLLDTGADVNSVGGERGTALQAASFKESTEVVQLLLDAGAGINFV